MPLLGALGRPDRLSHHRLAHCPHWYEAPNRGTASLGPQPSGDAGPSGDENAGQVGPKCPGAALFRILGVAVGYLGRNTPSICQNLTDVSLFYEGDGVQCGAKIPCVLQKRTPKILFADQSGTQARHARAPHHAACGRSMSYGRALRQRDTSLHLRKTMLWCATCGLYFA